MCERPARACRPGRPQGRDRRGLRRGPRGLGSRREFTVDRRRSAAAPQAHAVRRPCDCAASCATTVRARRARSGIDGALAHRGRGCLRMSEPFLEFVDLASRTARRAVVAANDEFFAPKERLIKPSRAGLARGRVHRARQVDGRLGDAPPPRRRATTGASSASAAGHRARRRRRHRASSRATIRSVRDRRVRRRRARRRRPVSRGRLARGRCRRRALKGDAQNVFAVDRTPRA